MSTLFKALLVIRTIVNFPTAFLDKFGLIHGRHIYKIRNKKLGFIARSGTEDLPEIIVVASGYEYDLDLISLPNNPTIVDLGGHIGSFSIYIARLLKDKCKIFAFEPDPDNFKLFNENVKLNKIHSIKSLNVAISNRVGKGYLKNENMNTDAYFLESGIGKKPNCEISTLPISLKSLKVKNVDLLKIDVEGAEYDILKHKESLDFILKNVHYMFIEYHELDSKRKYSVIKKTIEENFKILSKHATVLTLENLHWRNK